MGITGYEEEILGVAVSLPEIVVKVGLVTPLLLGWRASILMINPRIPGQESSKRCLFFPTS
jgi:hypothetical protein